MATDAEPVTIDVPLEGGGHRTVRESSIVFLVGLAQFVNILDFVMVMPLGPDFAAALGIPTSHIGYIGGSYTAAAGVSGLAGAFFLDRFDRRKALLVAMGGLVVGTALGGAATGFGTLLAARVVAGAFGGPATSLSLSIIADVIPQERRGAAMGKVMAAFSVASVLGVPAGLELARLGGWRAPFLGVAALGLVVAFGIRRTLPPLRLHLAAGRPPAAPLAGLLRRSIVLRSYLMTALAMTAGFIVIPNIATFIQKNLGYPRTALGLLYAVGGVASFATMRLGGRLVDRIGSTWTAALGIAIFAPTVWLGFAQASERLPVLVLFVGFMVGIGFRNVAYNTLASKVPGPAERAGFMSIQSAVQHFASAAGAFLSSKLLDEAPGGALVGMPTVAWTCIVLSVALPFVMASVEGEVRARAVPGGR